MAETLKWNPAWLAASGERVYGGRDGILFDNVGIIKVRPGAIQKGIDANLWMVLRCACDELKLGVLIYSADGGRHFSRSRHREGRAVDISRICRPGQPWDQVTVKHPQVIRLHAWLLEHGFHVGERVRGNSVPGVLVGPAGQKWNPMPANHSDLIHISIVERRG